jgi:hypothetical protein
MNYTEKISYLKSKISNYTIESTKWLKKSLLNPNKKIHQITPDKLQIGKLYFMKYDLQKINKSTKMEQFVPFILVDHKPGIDKKVFWILNLNFLPHNIKIAFFSSFLSQYENLLEQNSKKDNVLTELPFPNINYKRMWNELIKFGFEYAIREIRVELINDIFIISSDYVDYMTTLNTQILTGVDEAKLNEIWITKLKNEPFEDRVEELKTIKNNYYEIINELQEKFKNLDNKLKS